MEHLSLIISSVWISNSIRALLLVCAGYFVAKIVTRVVESTLQESISKHHRILALRVLYWGVFSLFLVSALNQLGFELSVLLGAAGILSVAVGFAFANLRFKSYFRTVCTQRTLF